MSRGAAVPASARVIGVDLARALALVGMFAAHLVSPYQPGAPGGVDPVFQVVAGRSSALFAVLAGVGIVLSSRSVDVDPARTRWRLVVRAGVVALLGIWLGALPSGVAVILTFYGVLFCCALPVLRWSARSLALLAAAWAVLSPVLSVLVRRELDPVEKIVPTFVHLLEPGLLLQELLVTGYYPVLTWATYLWAGMAIGRLDLGSARVGRQLAVGGGLMAAAALAVSMVITSRPAPRAALLADPRRPVEGWAELDTQLRLGLFGTHPTESWWWLGVWSPHSGTVVDLAHTTGSAMLVLGLAVWLVRSSRRVPWRVLGGAGAMTLTLYSTHVLVLASPLGIRGGGALVVHAVVAAGVGAAFALAPARGPLEQLVSGTTRLVPLRDDPR